MTTLIGEIIATLTDADERWHRICRYESNGDFEIEADDEVLGDALEGIGAHISYARSLARRIEERYVVMPRGEPDG